MDVRMPGLDGIEATRCSPPTVASARILMLTTFDLDEYVYDALSAGASGFLLKDVAAETLFDAVRVVAAEALLAPAVTPPHRRVRPHAATRPGTAGAPRGPPHRGKRRCSAWSPRASRTTRSPSGGSSSQETVKTHVSRVLGKLRLRDRSQAVIVAYESGLVVPRSS